MTIRDEIEQKLQRAFSPTFLEVEDDSERHRGHVGWRDGGETHFRVIIRSPQFKGSTRLQSHRSIHRALSPEPLERIHALTLKISAE